MVSIFPDRIIISVDAISPLEDLLTLQMALIEALRVQFRNAPCGKPLEMEEETATANFFLLNLLESTLPTPAELRDGLGPEPGSPSPTWEAKGEMEEG